VLLYQKPYTTFLYSPSCIHLFDMIGFGDNNIFNNDDKKRFSLHFITSYIVFIGY